MFKKRFLIAAGAALVPAVACVAQCSSHAQLNHFERGQFLELTQSKRPQILAQFLSEIGCGKKMLDSLSRLGAKIDFADEKSGYALVLVPRERLLDTLDVTGIDYAYTRDDDRNYYQEPVAKIPQSERKAEPVPQFAIPYPRVATTLPPDGPYFDSEVIGLTDLWKLHPGADGRGVRVAVPDEGFDLLHPALQQARDAEGEIVPKVADLGTLTSPEEDSGWVRFGDPIQVLHGNLNAAGRSWRAPQDGAYRFGIFKQDLFLGPKGNSRAKKLSLSVGVLWDEQSGHVWVDTDGDGSFKNERALGDYGLTHDIDWFGTKEGADDNRIPFGVKIDQAQNAAYIRIGGEHSAWIAGPLAGNRLTGGLFDGAAPGAQLVDENLSRASLIAAIVKMFARPDVDLVNRSGGLGRAGFTGSQEGIEDFAQRVLERAIKVYDKPIATYSAAVGTIHVQDYAGPEMLRRNRQLESPYRDTINPWVWWLPNGMVNTVLAPSANLETESRYMPLDLPWPDGRKHSFDDKHFDPPAPDGYAIGANNSPTIPVVSGVLADLISEAKREHVRYSAIRLNDAVFTGTKLLPGIPPSQQGYGLINAAQSWAQLSKMSRADDPRNTELTTFKLSEIKTGKEIEVQGFQTDLARAGETVDGEIWITRRGGYAGPRAYTFALRGNDGSVTLLDSEATLVRGEPARVRFKNIGVPGWHIVFLELRDARADVVMHDVPLSVRVPDIPEKVEPGTDRYQSTIQPLTAQFRYIHIGEEVQAARYVMRIPYTGPENVSTRFGLGLRYRTMTAPLGESVDEAHHVGPMETIESLLINDAPGNQQFFWENHGRPEYATRYDGPAPDVPIHAELTVTKYAVGLAKIRSQILSITNQLAVVDGHVELYDAKLDSSELHGQGNHAMAASNFELPPNLDQWRVKVTGAIARVHTDAYLFNCAGKKGCSVASQQEITDMGALLIVDKPVAGTWKIVIRSREAVNGNSTFQLSEAQLTPTQMEVAETNTKHASGEKWTVALPSSTRYAAFRIAGTPGIEGEKDGLVIAMTPLDGNAP